MQEILDLTLAEQLALYKRLERYALRRMMRLKWRGAYIARGGSVPKGCEPGDFVNDAVRNALAGKRKWNKDKYPTLERFLCSVIRSSISHLVESVDNTSGRRDVSPVSDEEMSMFDVSGREPEPLIIVFDHDLRVRLTEASKKELAGDSFAQELLECLKADIIAPADIAAVMGCSVDDVNNGKKRLARKLAAIDTIIEPAKRNSK